MRQITCFKAYDIRGRIPDDLNEDIAYRIGRAYAEFLKPSKVIIGRDVRLSSEALSTALSRGLTDAGVEVFDIGLCGTEEVYFSTFHNCMDGGIMVTASHNPMDYNGMKLVREMSKPVSGDSGLLTIKQLAEENRFPDAAANGNVTPLDDREAYIRHLQGLIDQHKTKPKN